MARRKRVSGICLSKALRKEGMSQTKMAKIFGVHQSYINHILHGRYRQSDARVYYYPSGLIKCLKWNTVNELKRADKDEDQVEG